MLGLYFTDSASQQCLLRFMPNVSFRPPFAVALHLTKSVHDVYEDISSIRLSGARLMRHRNSWELVVARKSLLKDLEELRSVVAIAHPNLTIIKSIFNAGDQKTIVYEYPELCFFDFPSLIPLTQTEIAIAASQV